MRLQDLKEKIEQHYRVRLILDNLPVTTYDLELDPESVRPGFELGFVAGDRHFIHNHLMFKILVRGRLLPARSNTLLTAAAASRLCWPHQCQRPSEQPADVEPVLCWTNQSASPV